MADQVVMATSDFDFESFVRKLKRYFSKYLDEGFIMDLEDNWYMGRYKTQTLASLICKKIPDYLLTGWVRNGVEAIQMAPFESRSRPKYCESERGFPIVNPLGGYLKEAYSETAITDTDVVTFQYYVNLLEKGIRDYSELDIMVVLSWCPNRNFLEKGLFTIALSAKDLVKEIKARDKIIWECLEWYMNTLEGIIERDINLDEDIPFLYHGEILGEDELRMFKSTYRMLVELRNLLGVDDEHRQVLEYDQQLKVLKLENQDLEERNDWEKESVRKHDHQLKLLNQENQDLEDRNKENENKMRDNRNELNKTKANLRRTDEKNNRLQKDNLKFMQEAHQYKQERERVAEELRKKEETLSSAQERIERLERNVEDEQRQSANAKSELQHTIGINEDLQTNILKLRQEAERYKQERDIVKEELQKANEKTISSQKGIAQLEQKLEEQHCQLANLESELRQTQENKEVLQNSQVTAAHLTHGNQSIAELSDVNRPTKLAERLSELYDNEWTDAFKAIEDGPGNVASKEDIAKKLKDILRNCFEKCVDISNQQLANIEATLFNPGSGKHTSSSRQLTPKQAMTITDLRRETSIFSTEHIKQEMCRRFHDSTKLKDLKLFIEKCSELCWLMAVQSPPVVIEDRHRPGDRFDGDVFKAYTKSGKVIEYVVWPSVYLHKGGPLLCKGIAQCKE